MFYLTVTSGVMVNIHYCMGAIASITYGATEEKGCSKCGMEESSACCHTEVKVIKSDDNHTSPSYATYITGISDHPQVIGLFQAAEFALSSEDTGFSHYRPPPDSRAGELFKYNRVFRI